MTNDELLSELKALRELLRESDAEILRLRDKILQYDIRERVRAVDGLEAILESPPPDAL